MFLMPLEEEEFPGYSQTPIVYQKTNKVSKELSPYHNTKYDVNGYNGSSPINSTNRAKQSVTFKSRCDYARIETKPKRNIVTIITKKKFSETTSKGARLRYAAVILCPTLIARHSAGG